jgi:virginiamycin B lyase
MAAAIPGRGTLSGTVKAPKPFQAAQVYAHHLEKNVIFMVYTAGGNFRAINLFPGTYDVWVEKRGFSSDTQKVQVEAGKNAAIEIALREGEARPAPASRGGMGADTPPQGARQAPEQVPYDQLFPNEPGRESVEKSCVYCHTANFIAGSPRSREEWQKAIALMNGDNQAETGYEGALLPRSTFTEPQWTTLLDYLARNFGPNAPRRAVRPPEDVNLPLDEQVLSKAMWVEYRLANVAPFKQRRAQEPNLDNKGNVWFTERGNPSSVGRIIPKTAELRDYMNPVPEGSPHGLVADLDGYIWWAGRDVYLGRIHPGSGEIRQYPVEKMGWHGHTPVLDSKGNIWFSMLPGNKIGKWNRATDKITLFDNPTQGGRPYGIFVDPKDRVWFANFHRCGVGTFDPATGKWEEFTAPSGKACLIRRLGIDPKGVVWFGEFSAGKLARVDPATKQVTEIAMPVQPSQPYDVWPDGKGNVWITDDGSQASMIKYEPDAKRFTYYPAPQQADMPKVAHSHDGGIWYAPRSSSKAAVGVFYADMSTMEEAPYYSYPERR